MKLRRGSPLCKRLAVLIFGLAALPAFCALYSAKSGPWDDPATWGEKTLIPKSGDEVVLHDGHVVTVGEGVSVTDVTVQIRRIAGMATGCVMRVDGGFVSNSVLMVGHVQSGSPAATDRAFLELVRGKIYSTRVGNNNAVLVNGRGAVVQTGGLLSGTQMDIAKYGHYEIAGGTNSVAKIYQSGDVPAGGAAAFTNLYIHGTAYVSSSDFIDNSATTVVEGPNVTIVRGNVNWQLPQDAYNDSRVVFRNYTGGFSNIYCGCGGNDTRKDYTGTVEVVAGSRLRLPSLGDRLASAARARSGSRYRVEAAKLWSRSLPLGWNAGNSAINGCFHSVEVGKDAHWAVGNEAQVDSVSGCDPWSIPDGSYGGRNAGDLSLGNGGTVRINGGKLRIWDRFYMQAGGDFEMTDGYFQCYRVYSNPQTLTDLPFRLRLKGGTFRVRNVFRPGEGWKDPQEDAAAIEFEQSGGFLWSDPNTICFSMKSTNNVNRYVFSGGSMTSNIYFSLGSRFAEMRRVGSAGSPEFQAIQGVTNFLHTFVFDRSAKHLAPWTFRNGNEAVRSGHLRLRLDGGVALLPDDTYTLMRLRQEEEDGTPLNTGTFLKGNNNNAKTANFASLPDTNLWQIALSSDACSVSTSMTAPVSSETLPWRKGALALDCPRAMGTVPVARVRKDNLKVWTLDLGVRAPDGTAADAALLAKLAADFAAAGYEAETSSAEGCDLRLKVAPADVPDGTAFRFVWDFTETTSPKAAEAGTVVTNALLSSVSCSYIPLHKGLTIVLR